MDKLHWQLNMGRKDTSFGGKLQYLWVISHKLNYSYMIVVAQIYIRYVVISIILITVMLDIESFYLTQLRSFIGCYFEYLPLFIPYKFVVFPWQGWRISRRFPSFITSTLVICIYNFCKVCGIIDGFNKPSRKISSGVE